MTAEWFLYSGLKLGLTREETLTVPFSFLLDLIAIDLIKNGLVERKMSEEEEEAEFFKLMEYK